MIEGGSKILSSFLHAPPKANGDPLVDSVVITVGPLFIGEGIGVFPAEHADNLPVLNTVRTEALGKDAVMICSIGYKSK